jgi:hypothetical protein
MIAAALMIEIRALVDSSVDVTLAGGRQSPNWQQWLPLGGSSGEFEFIRKSR